VIERGWSGQQAYAICSLAVDLKFSHLVDGSDYAGIGIPARRLLY